MNVRKLLSGGLVVFLFIQLLLAPVSIAEAQAPPSLSAEGAALIDVASGRILYSKNGTKKMRIASLTKTMTAIVAIETGKLDDVVTVPPEAVGVEGSSIYLKRSEKLTLEELLYGLMLRSGNDAAVTIATHIGGSVPGFTYLMNEKAALIGMEHTNFTNPHGLDDSNQHYSTPEDMAKLSAYALRNPVFRQIVSTKVKDISWEGEEWDRRLLNKNKMLHLYNGADGVKTGYTKLAKRCLAASATRDGRQLATITLNASDDWNDSAKLLDYGFAQFPLKQLVGEGQDVQPEMPLTMEAGTHLVTQNAFRYPLQTAEEAGIKQRVVVGQSTITPKMDGQLVGFLQLYLKEQMIGQVPLLVRADAPTSSQPLTGAHAFWKQLWDIVAGGLWSA
ncbi:MULTISPECIES: D-alanyl-D-alanine carboxypeptidase family protein [Brevibacillus]|uniref:D-alanyl-D-alanine carboxypeptidase family protein n=1 Tax=Brevibacillus TaxID=55080 RepID=UPI000401AE3E|nr:MULTISPECIES: D-alanyl-D-alanine carboxypeptidase family protein [Brevibacillus]MBY0050456.1 D-alanyl-D-alanine carboxypeptidase [Brevibacillus agri]MCG5249956.1 D-alanyl-D-alanine carboxypeptidase [Brevibacillus agri]MDR9503027.1 D-alanyl-D-alanine carboxypeptidase family protein [Brevibacillus agri]MED1823744.1 D-alanyl-D-alanine carboxypeptidase [Brevibacillus agri]MED4570222.1 D-alanyl-D-alanine carboxypeptidase [Brevibacillus agri]